MKRSLLITALLLSALSLKVSAANEKLIPYDLSNAGVTTCTLNGNAYPCGPSDFRVSSAGYDQSTNTFQFTSVAGNRSMIFPPFINGHAQLTRCVSELGNHESKRISCSRFGYPARDTKNFKNTFKVFYAKNSIIKMSIQGDVLGTAHDGTHYQGTVDFNDIIFLPTD